MNSTSSTRNNMKLVALTSFIILLIMNCCYGQLDVCTVATTSMIPSFGSIPPNIFNDFSLFGTMCPFGYLKVSDPVTGDLSCKTLDQFLFETVDKKSCFVDTSDPFFDPNFPAKDDANCLLDYLACSTTTFKCTYIETRFINDTCTDRVNCYGHMVNPFINCYQGKCTHIEPNPVLPEGSACPIGDLDLETILDKSLVNYQNNTYDTCDNESICRLVSSDPVTVRQCIRADSSIAQPYESCGFREIQNELGEPITVYRRCQSGNICSASFGICFPRYNAPDIAAPYLVPYRSEGCRPDMTAVPVEFINNTYTCENYTSTNCSTFSDCLGGVVVPGFTNKPGKDIMKWEYDQITRCDTGSRHCLRLFGKSNGDACQDNTDCYSVYCNTTLGVCTDLPSELECAATFDDPSVTPCPSYSYCGCSSAQRRVCIDLCQSRLTDFVACSMNYGVTASIQYQHPLQPIFSKSIPLIDLQSSIFSPTTGKCASPAMSYLNCLYDNQIKNSIDARSPSAILSGLTQGSNSNRAVQVTSAAESAKVEINIGSFKRHYSTFYQSNTESRATKDLTLINPISKVDYDVSKLVINELDFLNSSQVQKFKADSSPTYTVSDGSVLTLSNQIVVYTYDNLVALIPKFKTSNSLNSPKIRASLTSARICTCCNQNVRNLTIDASKSLSGIILRGVSGYEFSYIATYTKTTDSLSVSTFEPIMGHDSFLNRNWYSSCDIIIAPAEEVDTMILSIKNNMLFLDKNDTFSATISSLDALKPQNFVEIYTSNIPTKAKTIPRAARDASLRDEEIFVRVKETVKAEILKDLNSSTSVANYFNQNDCNVFKDIDIKQYHKSLFSVPNVLLSRQVYTIQAISISDAMVEYDLELFNEALKQFITPTVLSDWSENVVNPNCYSSYNNYLGVFHFNNPVKYWELTFKDSMLYLVIIFCLIFYIGLTLNYGVLRENNLAMRRRLFVPFIAPLCIIATCVFYLEPILMGVFKNVGMSVFALIPVPDYAISLLCSSYIVVTIRFFYLRNLYQLREFSPLKRETKPGENRMKIYRIASRPEISLMVSLLLSLVLAGIWYGVYYGILYGVVIQRFKRFEWSLQFDASLLSLSTQFAFLSLVVFLIFAADMALNVRVIRAKGFKHYFFFDDPFYLRIDIFTLAAMFITSIVLILDVFVWNTLIINRLCLVAFFVFSLMLVGGNVMMVDLLSYARRIKESCVGESKPLDDFGKLEVEWKESLTDINFRSLQRKYSNNEFSIENFNFYEDLETLENDESLNLDFLNYLNTNYFIAGAPYAVNLPSRCYTDFATALNALQLNPDTVLPLSTFKEIQYEVVKNNLDTFQRLRHTNEFLKWKETFKFQQEMNVIKKADIVMQQSSQ